MDKRYQVFVSSPFAASKEARQDAMRTLMKINCIPAGMESLPAADEQAWDFIKKVIDDCDYYLLIIGGSHGSLSKERLSYTEKKFDYAVEKNLKIIALLHKESDNFAFGESETESELKEKLTNFMMKVKNGILVDLWMEPNELPEKIALSMLHAIKIYPATGWIRADQITSQDLLSDINEIRNENRFLQKTLFYNRKSSRLRI